MRESTAAFFGRLRHEYILGRLNTQVFDPVLTTLADYQSTLQHELSVLPDDEGHQTDRSAIAEDLRLVGKAMEILAFERERFEDMGRFFLGDVTAPAP